MASSGAEGLQRADYRGSVTPTAERQSSWLAQVEAFAVWLIGARLWPWIRPSTLDFCQLLCGVTHWVPARQHMPAAVAARKKRDK
jgi:hypothetical protein